MKNNNYARSEANRKISSVVIHWLDVKLFLFINVFIVYKYKSIGIVLYQ